MADLQEICQRHHILIDNYSTSYKRTIADRILRKVRLSTLKTELEALPSLRNFTPDASNDVSRENFRTITEQKKVQGRNPASGGSLVWTIFGTLVGFALTFLLIAFVDTLVHPPSKPLPIPTPTATNETTSVKIMKVVK